MKAFEKWLKENPYSKSIAPEVAKMAWRDALKWIKEEMISLYTEQTGEVLSLDKYFKFMKRRIEEELGETKRMKQSGFDAVHRENYGEDNEKCN